MEPRIIPRSIEAGRAHMNAGASTRSRRNARVRWLPLVALVLMGAGAAWIATRTWTSYNSYQPPVASATREAVGTAALAERVVVVLLDGLRLDASRSMPFLTELRRRGADFDCRAGSPSLSLAGRGTLLTGAWPEVHGQLFNFEARPLPIEHLFESARRHGLRTALAADPVIHEMFGPFVTHRLRYPPEVLGDAATLDASLDDLRWMGEHTRRLLREERPDLLFVDLYAIDHAGHRWGGTSAEYEKAVQASDAELRRLVEAVDLDRAALVVVSDHGHTDRGGHGGDERAVIEVPLVLAGRGVRVGVQGKARHIDVAPTIAALLGAPVPASSQGRVLFDALDVDAEGRVALMRVAYAQRTRAAGAYAARLGEVAAPAALPPSMLEPTLLSLLDHIDRAEADTRSRRLDRETAVRAPGALALAAYPLLAIVAMVAAGFRAEARRALPFGICGAILYFLVFRLAGLSSSLSVINRDDELPRFFALNMLLAVAACALAATLATRSRGTRAPTMDPVALIGLTMLVFSAPLVTGVAFVYWRAGFTLEWSLPSMRWAMGLYLDALAAAAVGLMSPVVTLAARIASR
jgi:hypothetical protein